MEETFKSQEEHVALRDTQPSDEIGIKTKKLTIKKDVLQGDQLGAL